MGIYCSVLFVLAVWFKCYHCQGSVSIQPSPVATAYEGDPLTLTCTYTGSTSPLTVMWYINNIVNDMTVDISTCVIGGTPVSDYEVSRYSFTCSNPYTLKISQTSFADDGDIWACTVGFSGSPSPPVSQTKISISRKSSTAGMEPKQDNLPLIVGVSVGGFTFILLVIIIICCCCPDCYLYSCCRKEERQNDSKQIRCNQDFNNHTNAKPSGKPSISYELSNVPDKLCMSDVIQTCTSEE